MYRFTMITGMVLSGIGMTLGGEARADHDDHELKYKRQYRFGAYTHVDHLALSVMRRANSVCWEMYRHYQYEPGFRRTYRGAYEMLKTAEYIHELVHHGGRRSRVAHEIEELDKLFHEIQRAVRNWPRPGEDLHGAHYAGYGLDEKMRLLEIDLHHLMDDAGYQPETTPAPRPESESSPVPPDVSFNYNNRDHAFPGGDIRRFKNHV